MEHVYNRCRRQPLLAAENSPVREECPVCTLFERCKSCPCYTVDIIHRAINAGKQISFVYCEYTPQKELLPKRSGEPYIFSPYAMLYNEDKYYVLGYSDFQQKIVTFRVDRIKKPNNPAEAGHNSFPLHT